MLQELIPVARQFAEEMAPGRYKAADLPAMWVASHGVRAPKNIAGAAWRAAGLTPYKSGSRRFWIRPEMLPPVAGSESQPVPVKARIKRRYTVDLSPLRMQPGDGVAVHITPDAITIRKATPGIEVK
jgi:hypothetical protein